MELNIGTDYKIVTDSRNFIVQKMKITQAGIFTKLENIGNVSYEDLGYYRTLNFALKSIGNQIMLDNADLQVIIQKLAELNETIDKFTQIFEIHEVIEKDDTER